MSQDEFAGVPADEIAFAKRAQTRAVRAPTPKKLTNKQFAALSPAQKRVAIAHDVLEWLKLNKLQARFGTYLALFKTPEAPPQGYWDLEKSAQWRDERGFDVEREQPVVNGGSCHACALGSVFAAAAERGCFALNNLEGAVNNEAHKRLRPFFSPKQLNLIECAFERSSSFLYPENQGVCGSALATTYDERAEAKAFGRAVELSANDGFTVDETDHYSARETAARVMRSIMQNIIDNGGEFIP